MTDDPRQALTREQLFQATRGIVFLISNMLVPIEGYATMALEKLEPGHPATKDVTMILKQTEKAQAEVAKLLVQVRHFKSPQDELGETS